VRCPVRRVDDPPFPVQILAHGEHNITWLRYTSSLASPTLCEQAIADFLASGSYDPTMRRIRRTYARHIAAMTQAVRRFFPEGSKITRPAGGFAVGATSRLSPRSYSDS
jgi:DNA-binding transcriptional MocR family regulator